MTPQEFTAWLDGFLEGSPHLTKKDRERIKAKAREIEPEIQHHGPDRIPWDDIKRPDPYDMPPQWWRWPVTFGDNTCASSSEMVARN